MTETIQGLLMIGANAKTFIPSFSKEEDQDSVKDECHIMFLLILGDYNIAYFVIPCIILL